MVNIEGTIIVDSMKVHKEVAPNGHQHNHHHLVRTTLFLYTAKQHGKLVKNMQGSKVNISYYVYRLCLNE